MTSEIGVVLVNYAGATDTEACLASLRSATVSLRIVVVDNTPDDALLRPVFERYRDVTGLFPGENLGFGRGNNLGCEWLLENTGCKSVFILNNDAMVRPSTIERLHDELTARPGCGITVPKIVLSDRPDIVWYSGGSVDWKRGGSRIEGFLASAASTDGDEPREVGFATGCAMLVRRSVLAATRGFDPRFFMYEEDLELSIRVRESNWSIVYVPDAVVEHRVQGSMRDSGQTLTGKWHVDNPNFDFHAYHMSRNKLLNALIHARGMDAVVFAACFPLYLVSKLLPHFARFRFRSAWPVIRGLWSGFGAWFSTARATD